MEMKGKSTFWVLTVYLQGILGYLFKFCILFYNLEMRGTFCDGNFEGKNILFLV